VGQQMSCLEEAYYWSCLEQAYYWSQIVLTVIALVAAIGAYVQLQTFKRFELLKVLEDPRVRKARRTLYRKMHATTKPPTAWWDADDELEEAASDICASYDVVGILAKRRNFCFFSKEWSHNIYWTYVTLEKYLDHRRSDNPRAYHGYRKLYKRAKRYRRPVASN
jgi:hypothetical protein